MLWIVCLLLCAEQPIEIPFFEQPPTIDGAVSENEWSDAHPFSQYYTKTHPDFGEKMEEKTVTYLSYDRQSLYVLFEVHQDTTTMVEKKGTRDNVWYQDGVGIFIDPLGNKQELYLIVFGLAGTICDMRKFRASTEDIEDFSWDAEVHFVSRRMHYGYIVEAQIPFANFRRTSRAEVIWNINFFRRIENKNTQATCAPRKDLSKEAKYECLQPILLRNIGEREQVAVIPYGIFGVTFDSVRTQESNAGFDTKVPLGASGVANFAFNPDFSQLEGDPLEFDFFTQYAIFFPEYRPFFIEEKGVFETDWDIYYSRKIQNPLLAGRYTYKDPKNQTGIIVAYDEEDTLLKNSDALASILRFTRQYGKGNLGLMLLNRYDFDGDSNSTVLMTDGNIYLPFDVRLTYQVAGSNAHDRHDNDLFARTGVYYHAFLTYVTNNWIALGNFWGLSPDFSNDLGYIEQTNRNYGGGYIARRFHFDNAIVKRIEVGENFGFYGTWSRFDDYIVHARDSLEYFAMTELKFNLFSNTFALFRHRLQKTLWEDVYLERWAYNIYAESKLTEQMYVEGGFNGGYLIDFNIAAVGRFNSGWLGISYTPLPEIILSSSGVFNIFDSDTARQALKPSDVIEPVYAWRTYGIDAGVTFNPTNKLSLKIAAERQIAYFAPGYADYTEEEQDIENNLFGVIEYKPSIGNVIYVGGRYPEKLFFFKFTNRLLF